VREKKVGDLEVVVEDGPCERGVENPLRIGALAEPGNEVRAVMGIVDGKMIREVAQCSFAIRVEPASHACEVPAAGGVRQIVGQWPDPHQQRKQMVFT